VKIQKQSEIVAKLNLMKQIDEKSIFLEKKMNDIRKGFIDYLNCVKDVKRNYNQLERIELDPQLFGDVKSLA
jgi:hypothetical protein